MATLIIEPAAEGKLGVTLTRFGEEDLARLKKIPGHRWNPERKQWSFPDTPPFGYAQGAQGVGGDSRRAAVRAASEDAGGQAAPTPSLPRSQNQ